MKNTAAVLVIIAATLYIVDFALKPTCETFGKLTGEQCSRAINLRRAGL